MKTTVLFGFILFFTLLLFVKGSSDCVSDATTRSRSKRHVSETDGEVHDVEGNCLDGTDPIYYVSRFRKEVCKATIRIAFEVFYERSATAAEKEEWLDKCVNKEVDESYMMWIFSSKKEHIDLLQRKRDEANAQEKISTQPALKEDEEIDIVGEEETREVPEATSNEEIIEKYTEKNFEETPGEPLVETSHETPQKTPEEKTHEDTSEENPEATFEANTEATPEENSETTFIENSDATSEENPEATPEEYPEATSEENSDSTSEEIPEATSEEKVEQIKDTVVVKLSSGSPEVTQDETTEYAVGDPQETLEDDNDKETAIPLQLKMTDQEYSDELNDPNSEEYQALADDISLALVSALGDIDGFKGVRVLGFGEGSVVVFWEAIFDTPDPEEKVKDNETPENEDNTQLVPDTTFVQKVANDVRKTIAHVMENPETREKVFADSVLAHSNVDLESMKILEEETMKEIQNKNPGAKITTVDMLTKIDYEKRLSTYKGTRTISNSVIAKSSEENSIEIVTSQLELNYNDEFSDDYFDYENDYVDEDDATAIQNLKATYEIFEDKMKKMNVEAITTSSESTTTTIILTAGSGKETTDDASGSDVIFKGSGGGDDVIVTPLSQNQIVCLKLRVTNMNFTTNLTNRNNPEFQVLEHKFTELLYPLLKSMDGFVGMEVIGFSYGSLVVNNEVHFNNVPDNVSNDMKDRINAAAAYFKYSHVDIDQDQIKVLKPDETDMCEFVQCSLYADCVVRNGYRAECQCRPGYISVDHDNCVEICDLDPGYCRNGGECQVVPGRGAVCRCQVQYNWAYEGERCENIVPRTVLLVSSSTAIACLLIITIIAISTYIVFKRRRARNEKESPAMTSGSETTIFPRSSVERSTGKDTTTMSDSNRRINPIYDCTNDTADIKRFPSTSSSLSSSCNKGSSGSTSTSSFFVQEHIGHNGPLPSDLRAPERFLHLQVEKYPQHKRTWHRDHNEDVRKKRTGELSHWKPAHRY